MSESLDHRERERLNERLRGISDRRKMEILGKLCEGRRMERRGEFVFIDVSADLGFECEVAIWSLPLMECHGFSCGFEEALQAFDEKPGAREELKDLFSRGDEY